MRLAKNLWKHVVVAVEAQAAERDELLKDQAELRKEIEARLLEEVRP